MVAEFHAVLEHDRHLFTDGQTELLVSMVVAVSRGIDPHLNLAVVEDDPDDDKILETTVSADIDCIVSGDTHLLDLANWAERDVVSPTALLEAYRGW